MFFTKFYWYCLKDTVPNTWQWREKQGSDLQDSDVAFLSAQVEAGLSWVVGLIDIGPQTDQIRHHEVMVVIRRMQQGGLEKEAINIKLHIVQW